METENKKEKTLATKVQLWVDGTNGRIKVDVDKEIIESVSITFKSGSTQVYKPGPDDNVILE